MRENINKLLSRMIKRYYAETGVKDLSPRNGDYTAAKGAMMVALYNYYSQRKISELMGVDRTGVCRYISMHRDRMEFDKVYPKYYDLARNMVRLLLEDYPDEFRQSHMNALYDSAVRYVNDENMNYAEALLADYDAKKNLGWPRSQYE